MKETNIHVLKIEAGKHPVAVKIKNDLKSLQQAVSIGADYVGLVEIISLTNRICLVCNEEGKLIGLTPNRMVGYDIICGVFYITGQDDEGNLTSLTEQEMEVYCRQFWLPEVFLPGAAEQLLWGGFEEEML